MRVGMPVAWLEWIYNWKADSGRRMLKSSRRGVKLEGAFSEQVSVVKEAYRASRKLREHLGGWQQERNG